MVGQDWESPVVPELSNSLEAIVMATAGHYGLLRVGGAELSGEGMSQPLLSTSHYHNRALYAL